MPRNPSSESEVQSFPLLPEERFWNAMDFSAVNIGLAIATWAFLIGGTTALFVGVRDGIAAIAIGNVIGVSLMALAACVSTGKYGIDQVSAGRSTFGANGMRIISILIVLIIIGWSSVLGIMFGRSTGNVLKAHIPALQFGPNALPVTGLAILALASAWLFLRRQASAVKALNRVVAPGLIVIAAGMLALILATRSWTQVLAAPPIAPLHRGQVNFMLAIEFNLAAGLGWWPIIGSMARYNRTQRSAFWPNFLGFFAGAVLAEIVGMMAALVLGSSDPTVWMIPFGGAVLGALALLFVAAANLTSIVAMVFSASLGLRWILPGARRRSWNWTTAALLAIPAMMVFFPQYIYDRFFSFLSFTAVALSPIIGVIIVDFFVLRRKYIDLHATFRPNGSSEYHFLAGFNPASLLAVAAGAVVYLLLLNPVTLNHATIFPWTSAAIPALVTGGLVHAALTHLAVRKAQYGGYQAPSIERPTLPTSRRPHSTL